MTYHKILMKLHSGPLKIIGLMDNVSVLNVRVNWWMGTNCAYNILAGKYEEYYIVYRY